MIIKKTNYDKLKEAALSNKIIIFENGLYNAYYETNGVEEGINLAASIIDCSSLDIAINCSFIYVRNNGDCEFLDEFLVLTNKGSGTKFLSDDGTYKEVSGGSGPVIIEYPNGSNEEIAITDEQIEAVKNGNVKIKLTVTGTTNYIILAPISIAIMKEAAEIVVRSYFGENITDAALLVDFTNKTISIPE